MRRIAGGTINAAAGTRSRQATVTRCSGGVALNDELAVLAVGQELRDTIAGEFRADLVVLDQYVHELLGTLGTAQSFENEESSLVNAEIASRIEMEHDPFILDVRES
jgi:hypothetical protein